MLGQERRTRHPRSGRLVRLSAVLLLAACAACAPTPTAAPPASTPAASTPAATAAPAPTAAPTAAPAPKAAPASTTGPTSAPAAAATSASAAEPAGEQVVRVGVIGLVADAGIFLAQERGYFAQAGIRLDTSQFSTAADMMAPLGTGQMDVATGGLNAGLYNSIGRGVPMVMVADKGSQPPGFGANVLVVRKDLLDSGQVKSLKDLKGRPVGVDIPGTLNRYLWDKSLMTEGLRLSDVQMQVLTFPDMVSALANKGIDAALAPEPFPTIMEARGVGTKFLTTDKVAENAQPGVIIYSREFATRQPQVAQRWMTAYLRGVRDYNRALAAGGQARQDLVQVLVKYTTLKDPAVYDKMVWFGLDPDGRLFKDSILDFQQWLRDDGTLDQTVPWEQLVDTRFIDAAVKELGPYQP